MQNDAFLIFRALAAAVFFATLYAGVHLLRNFDRLFGADPNVPSENGSARAYSRVQVFCVWAHVLIASGAFALLLH